MSIFNFLNRSSGKSGKRTISKLIVGLGNVGPKYENTRHNVGFKALDKISKKFKIDLNKRKFKSIFGIGEIANNRCILLKPLTFMNCSGEAVELARSFYNLKTEDIIVLVDDISFKPGFIKIKKKGSSGGHNGLKSIIHETGEENFNRIKIGVGEKPTKDYDLSRWVLEKFNDDENSKLENSYEKVISAVSLMVENKIDDAMNKFN